MTRKNTFFTLSVILCAMFFAYVFLVNKTVSNVVARGKAETAIASVSSAMGELEFKYLTLKKSVTLSVAYSKGFQDSVPSTFLARKSSVAPLSYNQR